MAESNLFRGQPFITQWRSVMSLPQSIIYLIHYKPEQCIAAGIVFLLTVWGTAISKMVKNKHKAEKERARRNEW